MRKKLVSNAIMVAARVTANSTGVAQRNPAISEWQLRLRHGFAECLRRIRRSGLIFLALVGGLFGYNLLGGSVGLLWIVALPLAVFVAALSLFWPSRRRSKGGSALDAPSDIAKSALRTHLQLRRNMRALPPEARCALEAVLRPLQEIASVPTDTAVDPVLKSESERLIGGHLPRLVDSYCALPRTKRSPDSEASRQVVEALRALAAELESIQARLEGARSERFDIERRFVALRFPHEDALAS